MSVISLEEAKSFLDVIHSADDTKIQILLDGAESEALQFLNKDYFGETESETSSEVEVLHADVKVAILLLLQANYQATPADQQELRKVAEIKLFPHRINLGV